MALIDMETALSSFPSSSSSSSSTGRWKYDVFISFRGEDTRNTFADLLYDAFKREGIIAFKDDEKLEKGKTISPELSNAIEKSRYAVVIFSKNYASSTWCLNELVKIVQCEKEKIWPVFYDVEPSDVRKQKGTFEHDFIKHEQNFNEDRVKMWRVALSQVGEIVGWPVINRLSNGFDSDWKEVWSQSDANGICQIGIEISSPNLEVKKIGVRLVFEQEVDDPDQPQRDNSECRNKRRRDEEDGAGPSGEAYSNNEPHPKTRRMYG